MGFYSHRKLNCLAGSILVIGTGLVVAGQYATQKSIAQTAVISINGAGASTVRTLFTGAEGTSVPTALAPTNSWFNTYGRANSGSTPPAVNPPGPVNSSVTFRYASVGSSAGITSFLTQTPPPGTTTIAAPVSFAASDDPLVGPVTISSGPNLGPVVQVPVVGTGIVLAYNTTGLTIPLAGLRFSRATYLAILNGSITNWNDIRIRNDNGGAIIAVNRPLVVVRRSDGSGTTFALSSHLRAAFGTAWNRGVGSISIAQSGALPNPLPANTVVWPARFLSASGGSAVADTIRATPGAVGYVDSATRLAKTLPAAILQNKALAFVAASSTSITAGFNGATDTDTDVRRIRLTVTDPAGTTAYPIITPTYLLLYSRYGNTNISSRIRGFVNWALSATPAAAPLNPNTIATNRGYAPLPATIKTSVRSVVGTYVTP